MREVASGLEFPEGPIAVSDGSVLLVEIKRGTLSRVGPDGAVSVVAETGGGPNGAAIGPDGAVYVCNNGGFAWHEVGGFTVPGEQPDDYAGGSIQRVDLATGRVASLYTACDGRPLRGPNCGLAGFQLLDSLAVEEGGNVCVATLRNGGITVVAPSGEIVAHVGTGDPLTTNVAFGGPDRRTAYVTCSGTGRLVAIDWPRPGLQLAH